MKAVSPGEVSEMARLRALMEGEYTPPPAPASTSGTTAAAVFTPDVPGSPSPQAVQHMKTILAAMNGAVEGVVREVAPTAPASSRTVVDRMLTEALETEITPEGARVGGWDIKVHGEGKQKLYDVVGVNEGVVIARDLSLYEAALGLVRVLNAGGVVNSPEALEILSAEREYASALHDAVLFARRLKESPSNPRRPIFEDRYGEAKRRAIHARDRVLKQVGDLD